MGVALAIALVLGVLLAPAPASASDVCPGGTCAQTTTALPDPGEQSPTTMNTNRSAIESAVNDNDSRLDATLALDTCTTPPCDLEAGTTVGGAAIQTGTDDTTPKAGEFGNATDLDANGAVVPNGVALGTDTTGSYVATVADSGAGEVTVGGSGSETAAVTLGIAAAIMRDAEASALTVSATPVTDPGTACADGDIYLDTATPEVCFCIDGATDNWACATLTD